MMLIIVIWVFIFKYIPIYGITLAFKKFNLLKGFWGGEWIGLKNFIVFFKDPYLFRIVRNTFALGGLTLLIGTPCPIIFSLFLNEIGNNGYKRVIQSLTYLPHFISTVIVVGLLFQFFSYSGLFTIAIKNITGIRIDFMGSKEWFRPLYIGSGLWQGLGWGTIIYLASIAGISPSLYESAIVEGANRFQSIIYITIPCIMPTITLLFILSVGRILNISFEKVLLMQTPLTYDTSDVISTYVYRRGLIDRDYSYGTAIGVLNSVVSILFIVITNKLAKLAGGTGLW